jgi:small subunit ribosomal protein S18
LAKGKRRGSEPPRKPRKKGEEEAWQKKQRRKVCVFCRDRVDYVDYKDVQLLRRFVSDRGKIRARRVTGTCTQHQRDVAMAVKNAREMALLPYTAR